MKGSKLLGLSMLVLLSGWVVPLRTATAALSPLASGSESVVFSDDFNNGNVNSWTNIGNATIGTDPGGTGEKVWYPTVNNGAAVLSGATLSTSITLDASTPHINVYMRVRNDNTTSGYAGYFAILFGNAYPAGNYYGIMTEYPGVNTYAGDSVKNNTGTGVTAASTTTFVDYRMQMDFVAGSPDTMNLTASYYNGTSYVDLVSMTGAKITDGSTDGVFKFLRLTSRNTSGDRAYFDSVQITTVVPEPATLALLALGGGLFLRRRRQGA